MALSAFQIFKIGIGPSSSHTVGPMKAAKEFILNAKKQGFLDTKNIRLVKSELFGSLALTGKGHATDKALIMGLIGEDPEEIDTSTIYKKIDLIIKEKRLKLLQNRETEFVIQYHKNGKLPFHTNGMRFSIIDDNNKEIFKEIYYSVGGGFIVSESETKKNDKNSEDDVKLPFPFKSFDELIDLCRQNKLSIPQLVMENEKVWRSEKEINMKIDKIWEVMKNCIDRGLNTHGTLPGPLKVTRRAPLLMDQIKHGQDDHDPMSHFNWINSWALAVSEENSIGGQVVTSPTNGAAGVVPSVIKYYDTFYSKKHPNKLYDFILTSAAVGMIIKINATVSGAEGGCQAEIGAASSMAAAGLTSALNGSLTQIENSAEMALEHFIGLTCDPVGGLVQIPCIERNAVAAVKSVNACAMSLKSDLKSKVSLDRIIKVMKITGDDMKSIYKETSKGGIAKIMAKDFKKENDESKSKTKIDKMYDIEDEYEKFLRGTLC
jgi:L-serine dehydratase